MAGAGADPWERVITSGRTNLEPETPYSTITVLTVDLDALATNLKDWCYEVYNGHSGLRDRYHGSEAGITLAINEAVDSMVDFALLVLYNRLRSVLERLGTTARTTRMNTRAPVDNRMEFPTWLSSLLSSIGPITVSDTCHEIKICYATITERAATFGRAAAVTLREPRYNRFKSYLTPIGTTFAPIDFNAEAGAFFTTADVSYNLSRFNVYSTFHPTHYENEDVLRRLITVGRQTGGNNPFSPTTFYYGVTETTAITNAIGQDRPNDIPANDPRLNAIRANFAIWGVNGYGLIPAVEAAEGAAAQAAKAFIIGRGTTTGFRYYLVQDANLSEAVASLRYRLTR